MRKANITEILRQTTLAFCIIFLFSCARIQAPPGGPEDKSPPKIIYTIPAAGTTDVALDTRIEIRFNEYIKKTTGAVVLLPPVENTKIKFKGKRIVIDHAPLTPNTTYRISISTGLKDLRNNALKRAINIAFSTGAALDSFSLSGKIYEGFFPAEETRVHAYIAENGEIPDTLPLQPYAVSWT
ncbi:hypothetical protein DRQ36_05070, partial [bacterium]